MHLMIAVKSLLGLLSNVFKSLAFEALRKSRISMENFYFIELLNFIFSMQCNVSLSA